MSNENKSYDFEFLFVNDGSRDKTLEIIKNLALEDIDGLNQLIFKLYDRNYIINMHSI